MSQLILNLDWYNQWMLLTVVLYGVRYGVPNFFKKLIGYTIKQTVTHSSLGKFLDFLFYLGIIYSTVFVFKII